MSYSNVEQEESGNDDLSVLRISQLQLANVLDNVESNRLQDVYLNKVRFCIVVKTHCMSYILCDDKPTEIDTW